LNSLTLSRASETPIDINNESKNGIRLTEVPQDKITDMRILIVDDEPDVSLTLKIALEEKGFKVDSFNDPTLALWNYKVGIYNLLILDIKMPKMNGFELFREIRKVDSKVKVCFLTALSELHDYKAFRKEVSPKRGERYYIQKPIENQEIIKRVTEIIADSNQT
jgi:two-component system response regulator ChvI